MTHINIDLIHRKHGHVGREHVFAIPRQMFWELVARTSINTNLQLCFPYKVRRAKQYYPAMANKPGARATVIIRFQTVEWVCLNL